MKQRISIITVCYNAAKTIEETLKSVTNQSYDNIEYIVIDGGSADGTQKIIEKYIEKISKFITEPDNGIYDAMNKGIKLSTGDIVGILNSDDIYVDKNVLASIVQLMNKNNLDAVYGDVDFFDSGSIEKKIIRYYSSSKFSPDKISWGWMPAHPALFLRRNVFDKYGLYKTDYKIAGDFEYVVRIFKNNELHYGYLPKALVHMRSGGISNSGWKAKIKLNQEVLRACRENGVSTNLLKILSKYPRKLLEFRI